MTDQQTTYDAWMSGWLEEQQRLWQAWMQPAGGGDQPDADAIDGFNAWLGGGEPLAGEIGERLLGQGRQFLQLAEALGTTLGALLEGGRTTPDWHTLFSATVEQVRATLAVADGGELPGGALGGLLDEWQRVAERFDLPDDDRGAAPGDAAQPLADYLAELNGYGAELVAVQRDALDRLQRELDDQFAAGGSISSLRELYNLWVDASEAVYAERAASPGFVARQAHLAHASCRLHAASRATAGALFDSAQGSAAALRSELERLRDELGGAAPGGMRDD